MIPPDLVRSFLSFGALCLLLGIFVGVVGVFAAIALRDLCRQLERWILRKRDEHFWRAFERRQAARISVRRKAMCRRAHELLALVRARRANAGGAKP